MDPLLVGCVIAIVAIFTWLFWPFLYRQFQYAIQQQADWGHTLVIPFISCWFVYLNRQKIFAEPFQIAWTGLVLVLLCSVLLLLVVVVLLVLLVNGCLF